MSSISTRHWPTGSASPGAVCIFAETCGGALALEHNGDLYSCDHYVEPAFKLGNIQKTHMIELLTSPAQVKFGQDKRDTLPKYCRQCEVRFACHGECPKNRFINTPDGEPGLNYLCAGYKAFFKHIDRPMKLMANLLRQHHYADEVMGVLAQEEKARYANVGRNDPCPCGSGKKFKRCHAEKRVEGDESVEGKCQTAERQKLAELMLQFLTPRHPTLVPLRSRRRRRRTRWGRRG